MSVELAILLILYLGFNLFATISADYKEWFEEFIEYNICEFILLFTLLLPTTILFGLLCILSIKPLKRKDI